MDIIILIIFGLALIIPILIWTNRNSQYKGYNEGYSDGKYQIEQSIYIKIRHLGKKYPKEAEIFITLLKDLVNE